MYRNVNLLIGHRSHSKQRWPPCQNNQQFHELTQKQSAQPAPFINAIAFIPTRMPEFPGEMFCLYLQPWGSVAGFSPAQSGLRFKFPFQSLSTSLQLPRHTSRHVAGKTQCPSIPGTAKGAVGEGNGGWVLCGHYSHALEELAFLRPRFQSVQRNPHSL